MTEERGTHRPPDLGAAHVAASHDAEEMADEIMRKVEEAAQRSGDAARKAAEDARRTLVAFMHPALSRYHGSDQPLGIRLANKVTGIMGSWTFIIIQTLLVLVWLSLNIVGLVYKWDPYPFILLNLMFSVQAAYASPLILMAGNVAAQRDRDLWEHDYKVNQDAYLKIEAIELHTQQLVESIDRLLEERVGARATGGAGVTPSGPA
jgi:hypothetical protein